MVLPFPYGLGAALALFIAFPLILRKRMMSRMRGGLGSGSGSGTSGGGFGGLFGQNSDKPGIKYEGSSLGRIVTEINSRGLGIGKEITKEGVNFLSREFPNHEIIISAQHRLEHFYIDLGFSARGEVYLEDDIDHIQMYFPLN